jgi:hypothetical protein
LRGQTKEENTLDASSVAGGQSNFEIDAPIVGGTVKKPVTTAGANLTLDGSSPCIDWSTKANGAGTGKAADLTSGVLVKPDKESGTNDDSFGQGTSENNPVPTIVSGSIPPNKSDLQDFGVYRESNAGGKFLDLFWSRVNSPSGTVDMDFELNKLACDGTATNCANNGTNNGPAVYVTPKRGSVTFKAYGPFDINTAASGDTCVDSGTGATLAFTSEPQSLTGPDASGNYTATASFIPTSAGRYEWVASYAGDPNNGASNTKCGDEHEASLVMETPGVATTLSSSSADVGGKVHDSSTLSWSSSLTPSGTVTYTIYTDNKCTTQATTGTGNQIDAQPGSVTVNADGSVPNSAEVTFQQPGTYYWQASYGGDANYNAAKSTCTSETLVVNKLNSTISTAQSWFPQDKATIDHSGGSVVFTLLKNVTNTSACTGGSTVFGPTSAIAVVDASGKGSGPFTASTANTTFSVSSVAAGDTYYWKAEYTSGDANHKNVTSACQESTGFTSLSNGSAVTSP